MDPRVREDDGQGDGGQGDGGQGMDPRVREDDGNWPSSLRYYVIPAKAGIHPRIPHSTPSS